MARMAMTRSSSATVTMKHGAGAETIRFLLLGILIYRDSVRCRKNRLPDGGGRILLGAMIRGGFLTAEEREDLTELARDGLAEGGLARRAAGRGGGVSRQR